MAFTRFNDDPCRINKQLQESTDPSKYMLDVPGNGLNPCYMDDPFIRMQKWGGNLQTNVIGLENDLRGLTRGLNRDHIQSNNYINNAAKSEQKKYPVCNPSTEQSRATHPAWEVRDLEQVAWNILPLNPQENVCIPFQNNLNTRILEKDNFVAKVQCMTTDTSKGSISTRPYSGFGTPINTLCTKKTTCGKTKR